MCVFTLCCFLAKFLRYSLKLCWLYKGEMKKYDADSRNVFLGIVFICSMENVVCVCAASLVGEVVSIETK